MNLPGRKKLTLYGLVLAAALVGLVLDLLGRPEPAAELVPPASRQAVLPVGAARASIVAEPRTVSGPVLAAVFERARESLPAESPGVQSMRTRNVFALSPAMRAVYEKISSEVQARAEQQQRDDEQLRGQEVSRFQSTYSLRGTTLHDDASWAIVGDRVVRKGEQVDGFTLMHIERYRVVFVKDDITVTLTLPLP